MTAEDHCWPLTAPPEAAVLSGDTHLPVQPAGAPKCAACSTFRCAPILQPRRPASRSRPRRSALATPRLAAEPSGCTHLPAWPAPRRSARPALPAGAHKPADLAGPPRGCSRAEARSHPRLEPSLPRATPTSRSGLPKRRSARPASPSGACQSLDLAGPPRGCSRAEARSQPRGEPPHLRATPTVPLRSPRAEAPGLRCLPVCASRPTPPALHAAAHAPKRVRNPVSCRRSLGPRPPCGSPCPAPKRVAPLTVRCAPAVNLDRPLRGCSRAEARSLPRFGPPLPRAAPTFQPGLPRAEARGQPHRPVRAGCSSSPASLLAAGVPKHAHDPSVRRRSLGRHPPSSVARPAPKRATHLAVRCAPGLATLAGSPRGRSCAEAPSRPRGEPSHLRATPTLRFASPRAEARGSSHLPVCASRPTPPARPVAAPGPKPARNPVSSRRSLGPHPPSGSSHPAPKRRAPLTFQRVPVADLASPLP